MKNKITWHHWVIVILILAVIGAVLKPKDDKTKSSAQEDHCTMAGIIARDFVKVKLVAPQTADFPLFDKKCINKGNIYSIRSYVDSKNLYNVPLRLQFIIEIEYLGGEDADPKNWRQVSLIMN